MFASEKFPAMVNDVPNLDKKVYRGEGIAAEFIEKRLRNLEYFLNALADREVLWFRETLNFLGIEKEQQTPFLRARNKIIRNLTRSE